MLIFSLVHWISVTSHHTCVWPYIEMNAANVAQYQLLRGKPTFVDKTKMDEESRFGKLSTDLMQEIVDNAVPVTTKKLQSSGCGYLTVHIN